MSRKKSRSMIFSIGFGMNLNGRIKLRMRDFKRRNWEILVVLPELLFVAAVPTILVPHILLRLLLQLTAPPTNYSPHRLQLKIEGSSLPECGWQPVSLTDLITGASMKKVYKTATFCIHPDKVQQKGANLQQKYIA